MPRTPQPTVRAIFFDFDGVLVNTEPLHFSCWAEVLRPHGIRLTWKQYSARMIGISNREMIEILCLEAGKPYTKKFSTACYQQKKVFFDRLARTTCRPLKRLVTFLRYDCDSYQLAVVSSSSRCEVEPLLIEQGIRPYFSALVCEEDVQKVKPAPDPYLKALKLVNRRVSTPIQASECLVVEDSGPGAEAGRRAGMRVVRVSGPGRVVKALRVVLGRS